MPCYYPPMSDHDDDQYAPDETAKRRDETIKRMIATPPKKHKDESPRRAQSKLDKAPHLQR